MSASPPSSAIRPRLAWAATGTWCGIALLLLYVEVAVGLAVINLTVKGLIGAAAYIALVVVVPCVVAVRSRLPLAYRVRQSAMVAIAVQVLLLPLFAVALLM